IAGLGSLENSSGVDADQSICIGKNRSIAHQAAGHRKIAPLVHRRDRMAGGQRDNAIRPAVEKRVALDEQRSGALLDESYERVVDVAVVAGMKYKNLLARRAGSGLQVSRIRFSNRVLWIDEKRDQRRRGNHLLQQLQLLWRQGIGEDRHAGAIAVRPVQALD